MILQVAVSIGGLIALWAAGSQKPWAWHLALANQAGWVALIVVTSQWGLALGVAGYSLVFARNAARSHRQPAPPTPA